MAKTYIHFDLKMKNVHMDRPFTIWANCIYILNQVNYRKWTFMISVNKYAFDSIGLHLEYIQVTVNNSEFTE